MVLDVDFVQNPGEKASDIESSSVKLPISDQNQAQMVEVKVYLHSTLHRLADIYIDSCSASRSYSVIHPLREPFEALSCLPLPSPVQARNIRRFEVNDL
jgi:hypothetical protein